MKKQRKIETVVFLAAFLSLAVSDLRASTVMYLDSVSTGPNQTAAFSFYISNDKPFVGFQVDISYPSVLTYVGGSAQLTSRAADQVLTASVVSSGLLRVIVYSLSMSAFSGSSGAVLTLDFTTGAVPGTYPIGIQNATIADSVEHNILNAAYGGLFTLSAPQLNISPPDFNFGSVPLYRNATQAITLKNTGNTDLHISKMSMNQNVFTLDDSSAATIAAGGSINRNVNFKSSVKGTYSGALTISSDDPSGATRKVTLSSVAFAVNELRVGSVNGRSGYVFRLPVSINNMERFAGFQFKVPLPSVAKYVGGSAHLSSRATDQAVAADTSGGVLTVLAYSPSNSAFKDTAGTVLTMDFMVQGQGGDYSLSPSNALISDSAAANIMSASYSGSIQVISPTLSLNTSSIGFGNVSAKDTARATLVISNSGSDTLTINSFSVNNSSFQTSFGTPAAIAPGNSINVALSFHSTQEGAQTGQVTIRSNDSQHDPAYVSLSASVFLPNVLTVMNEAGFKGERGMIAVSLDNMKRIAGFQYDLQIPSVISAISDSIQLSSRKTDHVITASFLSSGVLRVIAYSPSLSAFTSDSGAIAYLPVTLSDTVGTVPIHLANVVLSDTSGKNVLTGTNDGYYQILSRNITVTGNLAASWDMVSVPVIPENYALSNLFPAATTKAFLFDEKYVSADTLKNEYGYWLKFGSPSVMNLTGLPISVDTFSVQAGWNLIGSISAPVVVDSIVESPSGNVSSFYFGFSGGYRVADSLAPGMGYWVKVFNTGKLILRTDSSRIYSSAAQSIPLGPVSCKGSGSLSLAPMKIAGSFLDTLNYLLVSDKLSYSQTLYFGSTNADSSTLLKYELPPKPPDGAFDARFSTGTFLQPLPAEFDSVDYSVEIQTENYPVTVHWLIIQDNMAYYIIENGTGGVKNTQITGDDSLVIQDSTEHSFTLRCISTVVGVHERKNAVPLGINLEQNFPNPFNPSTLIDFYLPKSQIIDLTVFDFTGRKITMIAYGMYSAGSHEVLFNGSMLSSGAYIIRLKAGGEVISRKILLIK